MAVRTAELGHNATNASSFITLATVPSGETWIMKDVAFSAGAGVAAIQTLFVNRSGNYFMIAAESFSTTDAFHRTSCWVVLEPGDKIEWFVTQASANFWFVWVSGSKLQGVA